MPGLGIGEQILALAKQAYISGLYEIEFSDMEIYVIFAF